MDLQYGLGFPGLDRWRSYFRESGSGIFDVIENGIMVAASDFPNEFARRRDELAEKLFTCRLRLCRGCDLPRVDEDEGSKNVCEREGYNMDADGSKESNANSTGDDPVADLNRSSNYSYDEAEALTDEIDEENLVIVEVFRIKGILLNLEDESISTIHDSLRRLQLMALSVEILKETEIGKAVIGIRKHDSKDIRRLARTLISGWKDMVDEWVKETQATQDGSSESVNPVADEEEEGLPSPPLDEGVFFATQSMELSGFFDGLDDDGNMFTGEVEKEEKPWPPMIPRSEWLANEANKVLVGRGVRKPAKEVEKQEKPWLPVRPREWSEDEANKVPVKRGVRKPAETIPKPNNLSSSRFPPPLRPDKTNRGPKVTDEDAVRVKLEATKKKLHERYQQAENAKRQRTIQVMELKDIPKAGHGRGTSAAQNRRFSANIRR